MRPSRLPAITASAVAILLLATVVAAGGWASVTVTDPPTGVAAGGASTLELVVRQHGVTPVSWPRLFVVATSPAGDVVRVPATPTKGSEGNYTAVLTLPAAGSWALSFNSVDLVMQGSATLEVGPAIAPPAAVPPAPNPAPAAAPSAESLAPFGLVGVFLVLVAVVTMSMLWRRGRSGAAGAVSDHDEAAMPRSVQG